MGSAWYCGFIMHAWDRISEYKEYITCAYNVWIFQGMKAYTRGADKEVFKFCDVATRQWICLPTCRLYLFYNDIAY